MILRFCKYRGEKRRDRERTAISKLGRNRSLSIVINDAQTMIGDKKQKCGESDAEIVSYFASVSGFSLFL